jgi:hypothetical protein
MEVSGQLHVPVTLPLGKEPLGSIIYDVEVFPFKCSNKLVKTSKRNQDEIHIYVTGLYCYKIPIIVPFILGYFRNLNSIVTSAY